MKYWDTITERVPKGKIEWPDGKRLAVMVAFDYQSEVGPRFMADGKTPHMGQITEYSYGGRVGIWRILDIMDRHGIKGTFNTVGVLADLYPESVKAIVDRGHEIAGHSYDHVAQWNLSEAGRARADPQDRGGDQKTYRPANQRLALSDGTTESEHHSPSG